MTELLCDAELSLVSNMHAERGLLTRCATDNIGSDNVSCRGFSNLGVWFGRCSRNGRVVGGGSAVLSGRDEDGPPRGLLGDGLLAGPEKRHDEGW